MADCIDALITANIKTTCESVTIGHGYNTNCGIVAEKRSEFYLDGVSGPYTLIERLPRDVENDYGYSEDSNLKFLIYYFNGKDDTKSGANPIQYEDRNVIADFQKSLMADRSRGGRAQNSHVITGGHDMFYQEGLNGNIYKWCTWLLLQVERMVDADNPYQIA